MTKEGGIEEGREGGREGGREEGKEGGRKGRREGGREEGREYKETCNTHHSTKSFLCNEKTPSAFFHVQVYTCSWYCTGE